MCNLIVTPAVCAKRSAYAASHAAFGQEEHSSTLGSPTVHGIITTQGHDEFRGNTSMAFHLLRLSSTALCMQTNSEGQDASVVESHVVNCPVTSMQTVPKPKQA